MKMAISEFLTHLRHKTRYCLRRLCGKPYPTKRLMAVLLIGTLLATVNTWFVISSVYHIGKADTQKE